jgi:hypothetical protein
MPLLWFRGYLGETRGIFNEDWNLKDSFLKDSVLDRIQTERETVTIDRDDYLTLDIEKIEESIEHQV